MKAFEKLPQTFLPWPQPQIPPTPASPELCSPCELLSERPLRYLSTPPCVPLFSISERLRVWIPQPAIVLAAQPTRQPSPPSRPASQPAAPRTRQPSLPAPPQGGPGWRLGVSLPVLPPSFLPSLSLPASLPPPPAPEAGTVQIEERGDGQAGWGPA